MKIARLAMWVFLLSRNGITFSSYSPTSLLENTKSEIARLHGQICALMIAQQELLLNQQEQEKSILLISTENRNLRQELGYKNIALSNLEYTLHTAQIAAQEEIHKLREMIHSQQLNLTARSSNHHFTPQTSMSDLSARLGGCDLENNTP